MPVIWAGKEYVAWNDGPASPECKKKHRRDAVWYLAYKHGVHKVCLECLLKRYAQS